MIHSALKIATCCFCLLFLSSVVTRPRQASAQGCGPASFASPQTYSVTGFPLSVAVGDINRDGRSDIIEAGQGINATPGNLSVFLGQGNGMFANALEVNLISTQYPNLRYPLSVRIGEFTSDTNPDLLLVSDNNGTSISILRGDGAGGFTVTWSENVQFNAPTRLALADFDNDGKLDAAIGASSSFMVNLLFGKGDGTFESTRSFYAVPTFANPGSGRSMMLDLLTADFNQDGRADLATLGVKDDAPARVSVFLAGTNRTFQPSSEWNTTRGITPQFISMEAIGAGLAAADINGDNKPDVVSNWGKTGHIALNAGDGTFPLATAINYEALIPGGGFFGIPAQLQLADLDGDGKRDLLLSCGNLFLFPGNGTGRFNQGVVISSLTYISTGIGDFNGDGKLDLAGVRSGSSTLSILRNTTNCTTTNTPPSIVATANLVRQQGGSGASTNDALLIATVRDAETAAGQLTVTATTVPTGFTVTNIVNTNGNITANILVACNATLRDNLVVLRVSDGAATATADLIVHVTENQVPFLSRYPNVTLRTGDRLAVLPEGDRPFDNGTFTMSARAQKLNPAPGLGLAGPFEVNPTTGEVIHRQLNNPDIYLVTVTATDNCGATREITFQLTITRVPTALSFGVTPLFVNAAGQEFVFRASPSVTSGNPLSPMGGGVVFFDESGQIGDAGVSPSRGFAELRLRYPKAGRHTFTARYGGDTDRAPSESGPITMDINQAMASVSAASYTTTLASEQIVAAFGTNLAPTTQTANTIPLPTMLAGVTVKISDGVREWLAPLFFVSPGQINYLMPAGLSSFTHAVTVTNGSVISAEAINPTPVAPGLFTADATGKGLAAAQVLRVLANGTQRYENVARFDAASNQWVAVPVELSNTNEEVFLILYGTGIRGRATSAPVTASIGGTSVEVLFAGAQGSLAGLDQVNLRLPRSLIGRGNVEIALTVDSKPANLVTINVK